MTKHLRNPRMQELERFVVQRGQVNTSDVCAQFGVSEATARRDLDVLANAGIVTRVHGGAIAKGEAPPEPPIVQRATRQQAEKQRIGAMAADLVVPGDTVFISSGTTSLAVAQALRDRNDITVVTNSLSVMNALAESQLTLISLGGMFRPSESSFIGHLAVQGLSELRINKIIFGIRGIDVVSGLTNDYLPETMTDRAILSAGRRVIVVADHTKLGRSAPAFVAPLSAVDTLVTDFSADPVICDAIAAIGVQVILA
ncbi:MAG: DeoR/GlpR transcriptional regulator [Chloroflexi bacterium]|jgi:DeoR family transcriptional regulator of aga operon|nr:MAG: DeoR/GlpR transcriptional regulator [Chloroflexota bacterium]